MKMTRRRPDERLRKAATVSAYGFETGPYADAVEGTIFKLHPNSLFKTGLAGLEPVMSGLFGT